MKLQIGNDIRPFLSEKMFGLFFEDINYAADGGLYAEMLENRQFAFRRAYAGKEEKTYDTEYAGDYGWQVYPKDCNAKMNFAEGGALAEGNPHYMTFAVNDREGGFTNKAYDGICLQKGEKYTVKLWVRSDSYERKLKICILENTTDKTIAYGEVQVAATKEWQLLELPLEATETIKNGTFLLCQEKGEVSYGYLSMMPDNAVEGVFRKDLFDMLKELRPGFLRFPGGCIVEGANLNNRYRWKDTVGLPWERKWNWNRWAVHDVTMGQGEPLFYPFYNQSYGIGFYEYFLLSELLGAKPVPVLSVGLACQFQSNELVPIDSEEFREYLQDAVDLIEFANGGVDTRWGAVRAEMGHPKPFGLEYIGIGNEQWETEKVDFFARYCAFEKAVHEVYPDIELLGSAGPDVTTEKYTNAWDFYRKECKGKEKFTAAVDEHYYMPPNWFYEHETMYDEYPREIPVFAGEYAAHCEKKQNNWEAALAEASFMCGLERNADVIRFASVAPLFARKGYAQWIPDFIWFDGDAVMGTPGYYVQKVFGAYTGTGNVTYELTDSKAKMYAAVSADQEKIYVKIVNPNKEADALSTVIVNNLPVDLRAAEILQMSSDSLQTENVLGGEMPLMLREVCADADGLVIPGYSVTVLVIEK